MTITEERRRDYVENNPHLCPFCQSKNITTTTDIEGDGVRAAWQLIKCHDCGRHWCDIYSLTDVEERVDFDEDE